MTLIKRTKHLNTTIRYLNIAIITAMFLRSTICNTSHCFHLILKQTLIYPIIQNLINPQHQPPSTLIIFPKYIHYLFSKPYNLPRYNTHHRRTSANSLIFTGDINASSCTAKCTDTHTHTAGISLIAPRAMHGIKRAYPLGAHHRRKRKMLYMYIYR